MHTEYNTSAAQMQVLDDRSATGKAKPWAERKRQALMLAALYETIGSTGDAPDRHALDKAQRLQTCADWAEFRRLDDGTLRLHSARFCRVRLCPMCQWRRSIKLGAQVRQVVAAANAAHIKAAKAPYGWLMLTLTVRNVPGPALGVAIDHIHDSLHRMQRNPRWRAAVRGWLRATEVTHNITPGKWCDTYHPHIHLLLAVDRGYFKGRQYIKRNEWQQLWQQYAGLDYPPEVDIRTIKALDGKPITDAPADAQQAALASAVSEVAKYAAKPGAYIIPGNPTLSISSVQTLDAMLHKRRMSSWGGVLKQQAAALHLDDVETGDLVHVEVDPTGDADADKLADYITYAWAVGVRNYIATSERIGDTPEVERAKARADQRKHDAIRRAAQVHEMQEDAQLVQDYLSAQPPAARRKAVWELQHLPRHLLQEGTLSRTLPDGTLIDNLPNPWEDDTDA